MKVGDKLVRKKEFRELNNWKWGDRISIIERTTSNQVVLRGMSNIIWCLDCFHLVKQRTQA